MNDGEKKRAPRFGELLRAIRLGWAWYADRGFYVRLSPSMTNHYSCEIARTFEALSCGKHKEHYCLNGQTDVERRDLLESCAAIRDASGADYQRYLVNEKGAVVSLLVAHPVAARSK